MKRQPVCNFTMQGVSLTDFGLKIPSPFCSLELNNSEVSSFTSWTLNIIVGGDASKGVNVSAFEALIYSSAQAAAGYTDSSGIKCSFLLGWLDEYGSISEFISYQGYTLQFNVSTQGKFLNYQIKGFASLALQSSMPVLRIPPVCGMVQPSAVAIGLAKAVKATTYYNLDIDRNDAPTLINHGAMTTSFKSYVRGSYSGKDNYTEFPGLLKLSKSYSSSRDSAGLKPSVKKLSQVLNNVKDSSINKFLKRSLTDNTPQCASFSFWVDEPTMTQPGIIHYKSNANLMNQHLGDTLEYGTANTNILSISGSYNGVAYNVSNMNFASVGFAVDGSGNSIMQDAEVVNSWSSSLPDVFQTVNIVNDLNALATQFSGDFIVTIPGSTKEYTVAQPVSLIVMSGNTLSPVSGIYSIISVTHSISNTFVTTLKLQRLVMSSANAVASAQNIIQTNTTGFSSSAYSTTSNIKSASKVDFGELYPTYESIGTFT